MGETFAARLRALRAKGGYSRNRLAKAAGVSAGAIRDYEQGKRSPSLEAAARLAYALSAPLTVWRECVDLSGATRLSAQEHRPGALDFGKYAGLLLSEVPFDYLDFLARERVARLTPAQAAEVRLLLAERTRQDREAIRSAEVRAGRAEAEAELLEAQTRLAEAQERAQRRVETLGPPPQRKSPPPTPRMDDVLPWEKPPPEPPPEK